MAVVGLALVPAAASSAEPRELAAADSRIDSDLLCTLLKSGTAATVAIKLRDWITGATKPRVILSAVAGLAVTTCPHWAPKASKTVEKLIDWSFGKKSAPPVDRDAPVVFAPQSAVRGDWTVGTRGAVAIGSYWSALDFGTGVRAYELQVSRNGLWDPVPLRNNTIPNATISVESGGTYKFAVRARDAAGNWSGWVTGRELKVITFNDGSAGFSAGDWTHSAVNGAVGGDVTFTRNPGATATLTFSASAISVVATKLPQAGAANFWTDGNPATNVSLYSPTFAQRQIVFGWQWPSFGSHRLNLQNVRVGKRSELQLDAFVLLGS